MKIPSIIGPIGVTLKHCALALGVSAALVAASARVATVTSTYDLGASGSGTVFEAGASAPWIAPGTLPAGSQAISGERAWKYWTPTGSWN